MKSEKIEDASLFIKCSFIASSLFLFSFLRFLSLPCPTDTSTFSALPHHLSDLFITYSTVVALQRRVHYSVSCQSLRYVMLIESEDDKQAHASFNEAMNCEQKA